MKRVYIILLVVFLVAVATIIWLFSAGFNFSDINYMQIGVISFLILSTVYIAVKKLGNVKRGEPTKDELSKKLLQKSSSVSYYISLYVWLFILYIKDRVTMDTEELIGTGILAMGVVWVVSLAVLHLRGIRNE